jgi:hypothetical protein
MDLSGKINLPAKEKQFDHNLLFINLLTIRSGFLHHKKHLGMLDPG